MENTLSGANAASPEGSWNKKQAWIYGAVAVVVIGAIIFSTRGAKKTDAPADAGGKSAVISEVLPSMPASSAIVAGPESVAQIPAKPRAGAPSISATNLTGPVTVTNNVPPAVLRMQVAERLASLYAQLAGFEQKYRNQEMTPEDMARELAGVQAQLAVLQTMAATPAEVSATLQESATKLSTMQVQAFAMATEQARVVPIFNQLGEKLTRLSVLVEEWRSESPEIFATPLPAVVR